MTRARSMLIVAAALCLAALGASADETRRNGATDADVQDVLLLSPLQPIRLRLRIYSGGVPFRTARRNAFEALFAELDGDADGQLSPPQVAQFLAYLPRDRLPGRTSAAPGAMTRAEPTTRIALLARAEALVPALVLRQQLSSRGAGPALIPLLDRDGDGRLSQAELKSTEESLHCRDFNDDGLISEEELLAGPSVAQHDRAGNPVAVEGPLLLLEADTDATRLADILLARYDRNRDGELACASPAEVTLPDEVRSLVDENHDRSLSRQELRLLMDLPRAVEMVFALGRGGPATPRDVPASSYTLRRKLDGGYRLALGALEVDFRKNNRDPARDEDDLRFESFDANADGFLDDEELQGLAAIADKSVLDGNGDGNVSREELQTFVRRRSLVAAAQLSLNVTDQGYDLYSTLDVNSDGLLTPREMRSAVQLLESADRGRDGYLRSDDISYNLLLELVRGKPRAAGDLRAMRRQAASRVKVEKNGPAWFRKMDRNDDGDVTLREFLGDRQAFLKLDADGDGLLSANEASQAKPVHDRSAGTR